MRKKTNYGKVLIVLFYIAIALSVFSQISQLETIIKPVMYLMWIAWAFFCLVSEDFKLHVTSYLKIFLLTIVVLFFVNVLQIFLGIGIGVNSYLRVIGVPFFLYVAGVQFEKKLSYQVLTRILMCYVLSSLILAIFIIIMYLPSLSSWMSSVTYLYGNKNSAAQIFISSSLILIFRIKGSNKITTVFRICMAFFFIIVSMLLQCRTAIIAFLVAILVYVFFYIKGKKKLFVILVLGISIGVLLSDNSVFEIIRHTFLLDKYSGGDLNDLSSGRVDDYILGIESFIDHPFIGNGSFYADDLYISAFASLGGFGGLAIISCLFIRFYINHQIKEEKNDLDTNLILWILSIFYFVVSLFEAYPPFGPGVCSCMFWLMCGFVDRERTPIFIGRIKIRK